MKSFSLGMSGLFLFFLTGLLIFLTAYTALSVSQQGLGLLTDTWDPRTDQYGMAGMILGTLAVAVPALLLSTLLGLGTVFFLTLNSSRRVCRLAQILFEWLSGIPSIVYGILGILYLSPLMLQIFRGVGMKTGESLATGAVLLTAMVLPTVLSISMNALQSVPERLWMGAKSLGMTSVETFFFAIIPKARSGIVQAILLSFGRAAGETVAVFLVIGRLDGLGWNSPLRFLQPGQTLTSKMASSELMMALGDPNWWPSMVALGAVLVFISTGITMLGRWSNRVI